MRLHLLVLPLLLAACSHERTPARPNQLQPEGKAFKDMTMDEKAWFMKNKVVPTMKPLFQAFNAERFESFGCSTCHGKSAAGGNFDMPNPDLPRLPDEEHFMAWAQEADHAPWVKFMATEVKPQMAKLLGMSEYDPQTRTGDFSCHNCHMAEGE